ncbi:hypothetical protein PG999_003502 [Apiospora kogelbergensis]|uniref:Mid2 domain-containing protein n=1 Tax=Apiospora kogelbergensis TaxID=1337665 RepID=A0AAW0R3S9_9PEZI
MNVGKSMIYWHGVITVLLITTAQAGDVLSPWHAGPDKEYLDNRLLSIGISITFKWELSKGESRYKLFLFQDNHAGETVAGPYATIDTSIKDAIYTWTVTYANLDPKFNNVYYLLVSNEVDEATTHYFNITDKKTPKESFTSTIITPLPSTSSALAPNSPSALTTATVWQTAVATAGAGTSDKPLATSSMVGIIVGVVAALLLSFAGTWWALRAWKKKQRGRDRVSQSDARLVVGHIGAGGVDKDKKGHSTEIGGNPMSEAEARPYVPPVYEADDTQIQRYRVN